MKWLIKLLSNSDEASTNRFIGVFAFIVMVLMIGFGLYTAISIEVFTISIEYLFYLICLAFGFKGIEKIVEIIKGKKNSNE